MDGCKYHKEFVDEIKRIHLEIIDRLARIETKQDNNSMLNATYQNELSQLYTITTEQGKEIAALNGEVKNLKWTAGLVAGVVAGLIQFLSFVFKGVK
jgi:hypothetical protein